MTQLPPLLCTAGDLVEDIVVAFERPVRPGTDTPSRIVRRRGGSAANVAAAVVRAGARARFVGRVGDDDLGLALTAALRAEGVDVTVQRGGRTGSIVVLVDAHGERTFLTDRGAAADLGAVDAGVLSGADFLHVPAYSLYGGPIADSTETLARAARAAGVRLSVDASSTAVLEALGPARFLEWCEAHGTSIVFANEAEAERLGWTPADGTAPYARVAKRGRRPAWVSPPREPAREVPGTHAAQGLDTTGAGDAFAAGFLVSWCHAEAAWVEAAEAGHRAAGRWIARRDEESRR